MGAGKTTVGREVAAAARPRRSSTSTEEIERRTGSTIPEIFAGAARCEFRIARGGGRRRHARAREACRRRARRRRGDCPRRSARRCASAPSRCCSRSTRRPPGSASRGSGRPLAQDEARSARSTRSGGRSTAEVADAAAADVDDVVLAAAGDPRRRRRARAARRARAGRRPGRARRRRARRRHPRHGRAARARRAARLHARGVGQDGGRPRAALARRCGSTAAGRSSRSAAARRPTSPGFAAATYMRGIDWVAVPTTLVGQVDAAIGGKTAIDLPEAKNLVGAFHWPVRTVIDPALLATLPEEERLNGMAEVVKTGLLAGEPLWELADDGARPPLRRLQGCALPRATRTTAGRGTRSTSATPSGTRSRLRRATRLPHGRAVALGLLAALRLSGARHDAGRGGARTRAGAGRPRPRLGGAPPRQEGPAADRPARRRRRREEELPEADVRAALDELIAG